MRLVFSLLSVVAMVGCQPADESVSPPAQPAAPAAGDATPAGPSAAPATPPPSLPRSPAPENARVFIVAPEPGATVTSPVRVVFGAENVEIVPAGTERPGGGHHHLVINADLPDPTRPIPSSEQYLHFGTGATDAELDLAPGEYHLKLLLGDHLHIPHDPPVYSETVAITVVAD